MIRTTNGTQRMALATGAMFVMGSALPLAASAQAHHSIFHRHPTATGAVGGYAAYKAAKRTGRNRTASGRHRNVFQRHPVATGVGAAILTHHFAKHHR